MRFLFGDYALDTDRRELRRQVDLVPVEPQVFDLLAYLIANRDRVVSKDDLIASVWGGRIVSESALTSRLNAARSTIGDSGEAQRFIRTLPRKGIRFVGTVREEQRRADTSTAAPAEPSFALPERPSIAVLPFANVGGEPEHEYFADGMADEIITALSRCNWLFVIARNSSFSYKGKAVDVRQIGRELGVRYVLEGSVRRGGNRLRFTGQLIDATSGASIWADRFDGEMNDVFDLQDRFTESVVAAIEPKLQLAEIARVRTKPAGNLDAYELVLRAQQLVYEFTEQSLTAALGCLEQALAIDSSYAQAMALAAYCYAERRLQGWTQDMPSEIAAGVRLALRAVELGIGNGNVLWMAGFAVWHCTLDAARAKDLAYRSLALNPNSASALATAAWIEATTGQVAKGLELFDRAERLSPRDPRGWVIAIGFATAYLAEGKFDRAITYAEKALVQNPRSAVALRILAASLAHVGQMDRAAALMQDVLKIDPQLTVSKMRARLPFMHDRLWTVYADGLRRAGLPE